MSKSEVLVVGGGVVGAATAYELSRRGVQVTLVEKETVAWGASGRNPGYIWSHTRAEGVQLALGLAGRSYYDTLAQELDDFELRACGGMIFFFDHQRALFPGFVANRCAAGLPMELLNAEEAKKICPVLPDDVGGATWNPLDAHLHPTRLTEALARGAKKHGAKVMTGTSVTSLDISSGQCHGVHTDQGGLSADLVIVATGAWAGKLFEDHGLQLPMVSMRLQMAETEPMEERFDPILYGPCGVKQYALTKDVAGYEEEDFIHPLETILPGTELLELAAQRRDGRVLLGSPMDFPGFDQRATVGGLGLTFGVLGDHLPALQHLAVERVWGGLLSQTPDALPVLGPISGVGGLMLAAGHIFGMIAGPMSGRLMAQLITGEPTDLDMAPFRYDRPAITGESESELEELRQW